MKGYLLPTLTPEPVQPLRLRSREEPKVHSCTRADRVGIFASILCAIHCVVTPLILLVAPTIGGIWAHPASHWGAALLVVPLAGMTMVQGYRKHRRKWIVACGSLGIIFLVLGAFLPYWETLPTPSVELGQSDAEAVFVYDVGNENPVGQCQDACCPSILQSADGTSHLHIPLASIITTIGGIALILTHLGNLCSCRGCQNRV